MSICSVCVAVPVCPAESVVSEHGGTDGLPAANATWGLIEAEQLDAVSALCPRCRLLLVEAASNSLADLGTAENTAIAKGARFVANGWGELEFPGEDSYGHFFNHPGSAIVFAAAGSGYQSTFPAALPYVTAVGGTTLRPSPYNARGWAELSWVKTGTHCAILEAKPSWQRADAALGTGCLNRTENDVAADADPATGASVYDSYGSGGWTKAGGTALSAAIVTAVYALAGTLPAATASYPVTVTAKDTATGRTGTTRFSIVAAGPLTQAKTVAVMISGGPTFYYGQSPGRICLDSGAGTAGTTVTLTTCFGDAEQLFAYTPEGAPGAPANLVINGLCVTPVSGAISLATCTAGSAAQSWRLQLGNLLVNTGTGTCLTASSATALSLARCGAAPSDQDWFLNAAQISSGVPGMCLSGDPTSTGSVDYTVEPCARAGGFYITDAGTIASSLDRCLGGGMNGVCINGPADVWLWGPGGELMNESSGLCLDDPGDFATAGTEVTTSDCYGQPGEIWSVA